MVLFYVPVPHMVLGELWVKPDLHSGHDDPDVQTAQLVGQSEDQNYFTIACLMLQSNTSEM